MAEADGPVMVLHMFVWRGGGRDVHVTGNFVGWREAMLPMRLVSGRGMSSVGSVPEAAAVEGEAGSGGEETRSVGSAGPAEGESGAGTDEGGAVKPPRRGKHLLPVWLPKGMRIVYKFVVDGQWLYAPEQEFAMDGYQNFNNVATAGDAPPGGYKPGREPLERRGERAGSVDWEAWEAQQSARGGVAAEDEGEFSPEARGVARRPLASMDPGSNPISLTPFPARAPDEWRAWATASEAAAAVEASRARERAEKGLLMRVEGAGGEGAKGREEEARPYSPPRVEGDGEARPLGDDRSPMRVRSVPHSGGGDDDDTAEGSDKKGEERPLTPARKLDLVHQKLEFSLDVAPRARGSSSGGGGLMRRTTSHGDLGDTPGSGSFEAVGARVLAGGDELPDGAVAQILSHATATVRREGKLVLAMVGLPARGKTHIARTLRRHLNWMGIRTEIFNVGNLRRERLGASLGHEFFDPTNEEAVRRRKEMARITLEAAIAALKRETDVVIFDATNSTRDRRQWLRQSLDRAFRREDGEEGAGWLGPIPQLVFLESICTDERIIRSNVRETKLKSPDYRDIAEDVAVRDFHQRIAHYVSVYQPLDDEEGFSYVKLINVGRKIIANGVRGYLNSRILSLLTNLHITNRPIWITRHGESQFNVQGRIGGDAGLSLRGEEYARKLGAFMGKLYPPSTDPFSSGGQDLTVWTSTLKRTIRTAKPLGREAVQWKILDEIDAGIYDGYTYEGIAAESPEEYAARKRDKYRYRYPRGESYQDLVHRLEPIIMELMRSQAPVLIVSHQATLRVIVAYLTGLRPEECPSLEMPLHTVMQLTPKAYNCEVVKHELL